MIVKNLIELIGKTPMLEVQPGLLLKLERFNPGGSVKDRTALSMIEDAEKRGVLQPGGTIIEPTSGNTGVGLAWIGKLKGYRVILTMPETMSVERRNLLATYGAELVLTPGAEGMKGAISKAEAMQRETPNKYYLRPVCEPCEPCRSLCYDRSGDLGRYEWSSGCLHCRSGYRRNHQWSRSCIEGEEYAGRGHRR